MNEDRVAMKLCIERIFPMPAFQMASPSAAVDLPTRNGLDHSLIGLRPDPARSRFEGHTLD